jgi:hypothetical protein
MVTLLLRLGARLHRGRHLAAGLSAAIYRAVDEPSLPRPSDASLLLPEPARWEAAAADNAINMLTTLDILM